MGTPRAAAGGALRNQSASSGASGRIARRARIESCPGSRSPRAAKRAITAANASRFASVLRFGAKNSHARSSAARKIGASSAEVAASGATVSDSRGRGSILSSPH